MNINTLKCAAKNDELSIVLWFVSKGVDVNADGVMVAAAEARNAGKPATYNYLVRQGGIPVAMPVVEPEASKCKKCEKAEMTEKAEKLAKCEAKEEVVNNANLVCLLSSC